MHLFFLFKCSFFFSKWKTIILVFNCLRIKKRGYIINWQSPVIPAVILVMLVADQEDRSGNKFPISLRT